jgi:hypothetical protein
MYKSPIRCPSVENLKTLKIPGERAKAIRAACEKGNYMVALRLANDAMDGHGVENLYPEFPNFYYVNIGDTYDRTFYYNGNTMQIGSWGDFVEKHGRF